MSSCLLLLNVHKSNYNRIGMFSMSVLRAISPKSSYMHWVSQSDDLWFYISSLGHCPQCVNLIWIQGSHRPILRVSFIAHLTILMYEGTHCYKSLDMSLVQYLLIWRSLITDCDELTTNKYENFDQSRLLFFCLPLVIHLPYLLPRCLAIPLWIS